MNQNSWLEIFNSAVTFGVLVVIAVSLLFLLFRKDFGSKSSKR